MLTLPEDYSMFYSEECFFFVVFFWLKNQNSEVKYYTVLFLDFVLNSKMYNVSK